MKPYSFARLEQWSQLHYKAWMDVVRMLFGLMLHLKGLYFIFRTSWLLQLAPDSNSAQAEVIVVYLLAFLHIMMGTLIVIGLGTRYASLIMIPAILASVFFSNPHLNNALQIAYSVITLGLSIFYSVHGDGRFSVKQYMKNSWLSSRATNNEDTVELNQEV